MAAQRVLVVQDDEEVGFGGPEKQNFELYKQLQDGLGEILRTKAVKSLSISAAE